MARTFTNCIGIDDAPFAREHRGDVMVVGAVFARTRIDGVLTTRVRRDGANATRRIADMILGSPFDAHVRAVLLQGIALAGFNVVDIHALAEHTKRPVLVVARRAPDYHGIRRALSHVRGGQQRWRLIERAGPMEPLSGVYVQRAGLSLEEARGLLGATTLHGALPEPLRVAHLIAGGVTTGTSRGRA